MRKLAVVVLLAIVALNIGWSARRCVNCVPVTGVAVETSVTEAPAVAAAPVVVSGGCVGTYTTHTYSTSYSTGYGSVGGAVRRVWFPRLHNLRTGTRLYTAAPVAFVGRVGGCM